MYLKRAINGDWVSRGSYRDDVMLYRDNVEKYPFEVSESDWSLLQGM